MTESATRTELEPRVAEEDQELRYVARQPILDRHGRVYGYELLFRSGRVAEYCGEGDLATRTMLDNSMMFGMTKLTGGPPAFVNCTLESLTESLVEVLPPAMTVLEVLETLEPTAELVGACRKLKTQGFRIALDDFVWKPGIERLLEVADFVKVDLLLTGREARHALLQGLQPYTVTLVAEKVETLEEYEEARSEGFSLFQGYYFCRPALLEKKEFPANKLAQVEILRDLHEEPMDLRKVSGLVERDPAIAYRLLRLVNSAAYTMQQEVRSIESALIAVGEKTFRRIATLAIATALSSGKTTEILRMAFLRARFCELGARLTWCDATEQYLLGLFSLLPALLGVPMAEAIEALPLRREICEALLGAKNGQRYLLCWIEASERGDWPQCDMLAEARQLPREQLIRCANEAAAWADATLRTAL